MFYFNRYNYKFKYGISSNIGKVSTQRSYEIDFRFADNRNNSQDMFKSNQLHLWRSITLPAEGKIRAFSFSRHGDPLDLYFAGNRTLNAPKLVANLNTIRLSNVLSYRQTRSLSVRGVTCPTLITDKNLEIKLPATNTTTDRKSIVNEGNCKSYVLDNGYITSPITELEQNFPLAFSILIYTDFQQFEQLLRTIYRPQNIYCIHVDKKSNKDFTDSVRWLINCFQNVFLTVRSVDVQWGKFSVLEPELICIEELLRRHKTWKYFINLTGQEFPLRTNYELVKILDSINGANLVEGTVKR